MRECNQCGKCCIAYSDGGLSASALEIEDWEQFRPDIAQYVVNGEIWMDPEQPLHRLLGILKMFMSKGAKCGVYGTIETCVQRGDKPYIAIAELLDSHPEK